eukprot:scaffold48695_cov53-Attheya_sp.AAC.5
MCQLRRRGRVVVRSGLGNAGSGRNARYGYRYAIAGGAQLGGIRPAHSSLANLYRPAISLVIASDAFVFDIF